MVPPTDASPTTNRACFELRFKPNIQMVTVVRQFVSAFYAHLLDSSDTTDRIALATHELLENAVKYSTDGETAIRIEVRDEDDPPNVTIRTWNRTGPAGRAAAVAALEASRDATDALAFYLERMAEAARRTTGSGLGLARIRAEAEMEIGYELVDDELCVIARAVR